MLLAAGHSLGGALATLAAVEIGLEGDLPEVKCITFGAPQTGKPNDRYQSVLLDVLHLSCAF